MKSSYLIIWFKDFFSFKMLLQQHYNTGCWTKGTKKFAAAATALRKGILSYKIMRQWH